MGMGNSEASYGWTSIENLEHHFSPPPGRNHGRSMGYATMQQYAAGAKNNMNARGTISAPHRSGDGRMGYFNPQTGKLTVTNQHGRIITYFIPTGRQQYFDRHFGY